MAMGKGSLGSLLIDLELNTATLSKQIAGVNSKFDKMGASIKKTIGALGAGYLFKEAITAGLRYNQQLETTSNSIATLLVATSKLEDEQGRVITQQELYNTAMGESVGIMEQLQEINSQTPMGLDETAQIYKTMLPSMRAVGATQEELIELTKNLAIASGTAGIKTQALLAGIDGLATGTVLANSDLGRFLTALGLNNDALKESADVVDLLNGKLEKLRGEITMEMALSTLQENWNGALGAMTKSLFNASKSWIDELTTFLGKFKKAVPDIAIYMESASLTMTQKWKVRLAEMALSLEEWLDGVKMAFEWLTSSQTISELGLQVNLDLEMAKLDLQDAQGELKSFTRNMLDLYEAIPDEASGKTVGKPLELALDKANKKAKDLKKNIKDVKVELTDTQKFIKNTEERLAGGMTDVFMQWQDGALNFKETMRNVLNDISAQLFETFVANQAVSFLSGMFGGGSFGMGGTSSMWAKGGAFNNGVQAFANGGIVNSPTLFPMANGMGLMGEAGAEAVMPLTRTSGGNLGVEATVAPVTVNVINNGTDNVEVEQTEQGIDIIISKITDDITRGKGSLGSAFESRYGLRKV